MKKLLLFPALLLLNSSASFAQCNAMQNLSSTQINQLTVLRQPNDTALYYEQLFQIDSIAAEMKLIYAAQAGIPDASENSYVLSSNTSWINHAAAINLSRLLIAADSNTYADIWKVCKGMLPPAYQPHSVPLRAGAEVCSGLLKIAASESDPVRQTAYRQWAKAGLDSLMTMQLPSGAFPFPDLRTYNDPVFTPIINNYLQSLGADSVNVLQNGWIIDDSGTGEFKFDAGVIAGAFAEAFRYTGDTNYRNAAKRAADYLELQHFNSNYNYNTFVAYGMTMAWMNSQSDISLLNRSEQTLRYSVLPGQIPNGKWMDGHNAKSSYHGIMIHNNAVALSQLPVGSPYQDTLAEMTENSIRNFISRFDTCGSTTGFDCLLRAWWLGNTVIPTSLHDSLRDVIGRYINEANSNGRWLDVYTMGLYLEALDSLNIIVDYYTALPANIVFPNPFADEFRLEFEMQSAGEMQLCLFDLQGREILTTDKTLFPAGQHEIRMNAASLNDGLYLLRVYNGKQIQSYRLIKMKQ